MDVVKHIKHVTSSSPFPKKKFRAAWLQTARLVQPYHLWKKKSMQPGCKPQLVQPTARLRLVQPCRPALDVPAATAPRRQCARTRLASFFSSFLSCAREHYGQCNPRSMAAWWWLANRASASLPRARPQGAPGAEGPIPVRCGAQQVPALPAERSRRGHTSAASSRELRRRHCPHTHYICHERESERERRKNRENCG